MAILAGDIIRLRVILADVVSSVATENGSRSSSSHAAAPTSHRAVSEAPARHCPLGHLPCPLFPLKLP